MTAGRWVLGVGAAVLIKLSASVDDVAWLLPFLASEHRAVNMRRALQYIVTMVAVASLASVIAVGGGSAISSVVNEDSAWPSSRILGLASGVLLSTCTLAALRTCNI